MKFKHLLIECYCEEELQQEICNNNFEMGIQCINCPQASYVPCPNELALSNNKGVVESVEDFIGFGGDMEPTEICEEEERIRIWRDICKRKIKEAYEEYIRKFNSEV